MKLNTLLHDIPESRALDITINGLSNDTRTLAPGDCFLAYPGLESDGRDYMQQACDKQARVIVYEKDHLTDSQSAWLKEADIPHIGVTGLAQRLPHLAAKFYGNPSEHMHIIGVTGTNGKSSIVHGLNQLYAQLHEPVAMIGTLGIGPLNALRPNTHTTPEPITLQKTLRALQQTGIETLAMEVSSHALTQGRVEAVNIATAIFTNLTRDHLDYHHTMEAYGEAKWTLLTLPSVKQCVVNLDDPWLYERVETLPPSKLVVGYSIQGRTHSRCDQVLNGVVSAEPQTFEVSWGEERATITTQLLGDFNISNVLAMLAAVMLDGFTLNSLVDAASAIKGIPGRLEKMSGDGETCVIVDYAHTPDALSHVLKTLKPLCNGRLICVFGCGGERDSGKRAQMGDIASQYADEIILTNDNPRHEDAEHIIKHIQQGVHSGVPTAVVLNREEAIARAITQAQENDWVLIAGKGHETTQIVGDQVIPHDDRATAKHYLMQKGAKHASK